MSEHGPGFPPPKGHPYGENIRCHPDTPAPLVSRSDEIAVERSFRGVGDVEPATQEYKPKGGPISEAFAYDNVVLRVNGRSGDARLEAAMAARFADLLDLFCDRQRKYGPGNIAAFGDPGVCVRAHDKLARLRHHYFAGGQGDMPDESVDDAWRDLAVYAVIALVCREGGWPGWEEGGGKP